MHSRISRLLLTALLFGMPLWGNAQVEIPDTIPGKGFFIGQLNLAKHIVDFFLDKRDKNNASSIDSNYVGYYPEKLMFSTGIAHSGGTFNLNTDNSTLHLNSSLSRSLSLRACYRGMAMCFSINPFNVFGNSDTEFDISIYGDKVVLDFIYQNSETLNGTNHSGEGESAISMDIEEGRVNRRTLSIGAMYVFNSRRFSYAAAFDQTCFQKRSCGSFLLGCNYLYNRMRFDYQPLSTGYEKSKFLSLGGGYGYNLVLPSQWLVSLSAVAQLAVWNTCRVETYFNEEFKQYGLDDRDYNTHFDAFPVFLVPRLAIVHHFKRFFVAATGLANIHFEHEDGNTDRNFVFTSNILFGFRL